MSTPGNHAGRLSPSMVALPGRRSTSLSQTGGPRASFLASTGTPHRRGQPSFSVEQTPTQSQLNWPSVHRSYSSAAQTRDSSRRSDDVRCISNRTGGARPSSSSGRGRRGPEEGGGGATRRSAPGVPLLVDMASELFGAAHERSSTAHSHPSTALCTPRDLVTPPPPLEEFEAEARHLSREELVEAVEALRAENRVLRTGILRDRDAYAALREGIDASYSTAELRQESITNTLMRRLDAAKKVKSRLAANLERVEAEKAREEAQLQEIQHSIDRLTRHLHREEGEVATQMRGQLEYMQKQRAQLGRLVAEQADSLQQLEHLVQDMQYRVRAPPPPPPSSTASSTAPPPRDSIRSRGSSAANTTAATGSADAADSSSVEGAAHSPRAMMRYLEQEIASVEALRAQALRRADTYAKRCQHLEERVEREQGSRSQQHRRVRGIEQELSETSTAIRELSAQQALQLEVASERRLNLAARAGSASHRTASHRTASSSAADTADALRARNSISPDHHHHHHSHHHSHNGSHNGSQAAGLTTTAAVNLADVVLVPGTEQYAIPANSLAAAQARGAREGSRGAGGRSRPSDGGRGGVPDVPSASAAGPGLLDALLLPGAGQYTLAVDPNNTATAALLRQVHTPLPQAAHTPAAAVTVGESEVDDDGTDGRSATGGGGGAGVTTRISVQNTARMSAPQPLPSSADCTPKKEPLDGRDGANPPGSLMLD